MKKLERIKDLEQQKHEAAHIKISALKEMSDDDRLRLNERAQNECGRILSRFKSIRNLSLLNV